MAYEIADAEDLYLFFCKLHKNTEPTPNQTLMEHTLRALLDDRAALYAACVEVSAVGGEATSKAITDAAITASDLRIA